MTLPHFARTCNVLPPRKWAVRTHHVPAASGGPARQTHRPLRTLLTNGFPALRGLDRASQLGHRWHLDMDSEGAVRGIVGLPGRLADTGAAARCSLRRRGPLALEPRGAWTAERDLRRGAE